MARRSLSPEEETLWQSFARSILPLRSRRHPSDGKEGGVTVSAKPTPLSSGRPAASASGHEQPKVLRVLEIMPTKAVVVRKPARLDPLRINDRQPGLDTTSWNALATGKMKPQKRLDLHGHFAQDAFYKLHHFLHACSARGIRCVEVITGLGSGVEGGVIRQELPHWLERGDLRPLVLAVVHTHRKNKGAVRILLRARRTG